MTHRFTLGLTAALCTTLALGSPARAGGVAIVDAPGLGVLPDLQTAVNAAVSGDVLLVAPGAYAPFTIDGKSLYVFAMPGGAVSISGTVEVKNLAGAQRVILSGISVTAPTATVLAQPPPGLRLSSNAGHVRLQSCSFVGGQGKQGTCYANGAGGHGAVATDSTRVAFIASTLRGGRGYHNTTVYSDCTGGNGGHGLEATGSVVALYDCNLRGGDGGQYGFQGGNGGHGAHQADFGLFASGSTFLGGVGGYAADYLAAYGGDGGDGLRVDPSAQAQLVDGTYTGGIHGESFIDPKYDGLDGQPTAGGGIFNYLPQAARHLSAPSMISELGSLPIQVAGEPGDQIFVIESATPAWQLSSPFFGIWLVPKPGALNWASATVLGAGGTATIHRTMQSVSPPPAGRIAWLQGLAVGRGGRSISCPMHVLVLDRTSLPDCDGNGALDWLDLLEGASGDCDKDLQSDACELVLGSADCNSNALQDSCDIASGASQDVNSNGVPDECEAIQATLHVDDSAAPGGDGSAATPFQTMAEALAASLSGDTILVHDGLYVGASNKELDLGGRDLVIKSQNGPANCIFNAYGSGAIFRLRTSEPPTTRIEGLTLSYASPALYVSGVSSSLPPPNVTVVDCHVTGCGSFSAVLIGRGVARFERCLFDWNAGGAAWISQANTTPKAHFLECSFIGNSHVSSGGAIYAYFGNAGIVFERCEFLGNHAGNSGGAIYIGSYGALPVIDGCRFEGNTAQRGAAIYQSGGSTNFPPILSVVNSTFSGNAATLEGGAVLVGQYSSCTIVNSILWGNSAPTGAQLRVHGINGPASLTVTRCDVQGGQAAVSVGATGALGWSASNVDLDPLFADVDGMDDDAGTFADNDYRLLLGSPCLDAGDNGLAALDVLDLDGDLNTSEPVPFDLAGNARFVDVPSAPDVGVGAPPQVDLGAYEHP